MKTLQKELTILASALSGKTGRLVVMVAVLALFVLAAGAPNATIGIGK